MKIEDLRKPLNIEDVDFRVQSIHKTPSGVGAIVLAYKNARVDQSRLDEVVGALNWKREHSNDNKNCTVSIWDESKNQWVSKEDTGTESFSDAEKGLASDSFKRACFNWGIGRELYEYPFIWVELKDGEYYEQGGKIKGSNKLKLNQWNWYVQWEDGKVAYLEAKDGTEVRFKFGYKKAEKQKTNTSLENEKPAQPVRPQQNEKPWFNLFDKSGVPNKEKNEWIGGHIHNGVTHDAMIAKIKETYNINKKETDYIRSL